MRPVPKLLPSVLLKELLEKKSAPFHGSNKTEHDDENALRPASTDANMTPTEATELEMLTGKNQDVLGTAGSSSSHIGS